MSENLIAHVMGMTDRDNIYSMTLTVAAVMDLPSALKTLKQQFKQLRRRTAWNPIVGGVWFFDCTYNATDQQWHPHLHLIVEAEGDFDTTKIEHRWTMLANGSVHLSQLTDTDDDVDRLAKYHSLPAHLKDDAKRQSFVCSAPLMAEYAAAIKGQQTFRPFGSWNGLKLLDRRQNGQKSH